MCREPALRKAIRFHLGAFPFKSGSLPELWGGRCWGMGQGEMGEFQP